MKLFTQDLPKYFTIATPENSHYTQPTNCLNMVDRNSSTLFVTVGESWTYGSELSDRLQQVWGNLVAEYFDWNWLNLAQPGCSNFLMADRVEELSALKHQLDYDKIIVVCLFTEIGRGFNSHHDSHIDYTEWFRNNCQSPEDFYKFLEMINQDCVNRILRAGSQQFSVWFASNFIDHLGLPDQQILPNPWFHLLGLKRHKKVYAGTTGVERLQQVKEFLSAKQLPAYKSWISDMIADANLVDEICSKSGGGETMIHPDDQGHKIWSEYVIEYLKTHETI